MLSVEEIIVTNRITNQEEEIYLLYNLPDFFWLYIDEGQIIQWLKEKDQKDNLLQIKLKIEQHEFRLAIGSKLKVFRKG